MRIIFLCGCLDVGQDGAGDQARRLAGGLVRQGHTVRALSFREPGITDSIEEEQQAEGTAIPVLRIPASWANTQRYRRLSSWIEDFTPDWISLQFVNMGFHSYGLPLDLLLFLPRAIGSTRLHIMFQELWCGVDYASTPRNKFLGLLQRAFIKRMIAVLKPSSIFTNTMLYGASLRQLGVTANLAPVFGNVSPNEWGRDDEWNSVLVRSGISEAMQERDKYLVLGFFGTVYICPGLDELVRNAENAAARLGRRLAVLMIGQSRGRGTEQIRCEDASSVCWNTGPLPAAMVNRALGIADIGVVTTSADRFNKSSTGGAWLERGIPVALSGADRTYSPEDLESLGVFQVKKSADILRVLQSKQRPLSDRFHQVLAIYAGLDSAQPYSR